MANRIKGITVEIGGDTTGLDKALKGVQSTLRTTQTSLRDVKAAETRSKQYGTSVTKTKAVKGRHWCDKG